MPKPRHSTRAGLVILMVVFTTPLAAGQDGDEEDLEMELFFAPAETVSSASRHEQPLGESPSAVTVLTREDIEASGARTLPELLRQVPNMDVYMIKPLWYSVGVRDRTTDESDRMLLLVDGRDVTTEFLGAPVWTVQYFSLDDVDRVEVIRGPGSALYGANAYSGVVQVITRPPGEGSRASVSVRGAEKGFSELAGRVSGRLGPLSASATAGLAREDLWTGRDRSGREVTRSRLDLRTHLGSEADLSLESGLLQASGTLQTAMGLMHLKQLRDYYGRLQFDWKGLNLQALWSHSTLDIRPDMALKLKEPLLELGRIRSVFGTVDKAGLTARYAGSFGSNRFVAGAEYMTNRFDSGSMIPARHTEHRMGVFIQDEIRISDWIDGLSGIRIPPLILTFGLRFDYDIIHKDTSETVVAGGDWQDWALSPRASLVFLPGEIHSFRLGFGHAYLKPSFLQSSIRVKVEDVSNLGVSELNMGNPDLENQTIDSLELGYSANLLQGRLVLGLDFAYNWHRNTIWFVQDLSKMRYIEIGSMRIPDLSSPDGFTFHNFPDGLDGHNLDVQVVGRPSENSRLFVQAGYRQVFFNHTGQFDQHEPILRLGAGADLATTWGLSISARAFYTGPHTVWLLDPDSVLEPGKPYNVPANLLLNARLAWTVAGRSEELTIGLEAFNLLDRRIRENSGLSYANQPDYNGERLDRRVVLFVQVRI